jgi:hypothetical protein
MVTVAAHRIAAIGVRCASIIVVDWRLGNAVREVLEHVEARHSLFGQQYRSPSLRLLQDGRDEIAYLGFLPLRALYMQHRGLQRTAECGRLLGLALLPARECFNRIIEAIGHVATEKRQVGPARGKNSLSVGIVCDRVQKMFERQVRVTTRDRLTKGNVKHDFDSSGEHQTSSIVARNG